LFKLKKPNPRITKEPVLRLAIQTHPSWQPRLVEATKAHRQTKKQPDVLCNIMLGKAMAVRLG
jgi:hypothetical protein